MPDRSHGGAGAAAEDAPSSHHGEDSHLAGVGENIRVRLRHVLGLGGVPPWTLVKRVAAAAARNDALGQAAKVSYSLLFALFPFMIFLTSVPAFLPVPNLLDVLMRGADRVVPDTALSYVQRNIQVLLEQERSGLLAITFVVSMWAASRALGTVMESINRAYGLDERRPWWKRMGTAVLLSVGLTTFALVAVVLMLLGSQIGSLLAVQAGFGPTFHTLWTLLRWPVVVLVLMVAMAALYYFGPDLRQSWRWMTPGAIFAVIGWILASLGFSYYVRHFARYDQLHGSFASVIMLMTWMYLSALFVILGGEINAKIEHGSPHGRQPGHRDRAGA